MDNMTETLSFEVPDAVWEPTSRALRRLRELHRDAGGTSRMTKEGRVVTLSVSGDHAAVLDAVENGKRIAAKLQEHEARSRTTSDDLYDMLEQDRRRRFHEFRGMVDDLMRKNGKR
jgi:hypothetical protein